MLDARDKRHSHRFPIQVPVLFDSEQGETRDVSVEGVYFFCKATLRPGDNIDFSLQFDKNTVSNDSHMYFACRGTVLRSEKNGQRNGVAVRFTESEHRHLFV